MDTQHGNALEQTEFDVILESAGSNRIAVVKAVREITGLGRAVAEQLVDNTPELIKEQVSVGAAEEMKRELEEAGGTVEPV